MCSRGSRVARIRFHGTGTRPCCRMRWTDQTFRSKVRLDRCRLCRTRAQGFQMVETLELLIAAIDEKRPLVLVLGQDAWRESDREDAILTTAFAHLRRDTEDNGQDGWRTLLRQPLPPTFYEWLTERFERRVAPDWLRVLGAIPWSAVFTSSIDPTLCGLFSERQRPELVLTNAEMPPAIRSRTRPPIYHLFGHTGALDPKARPPLDRNGLNTRRVNHALPLLGRVLDTATGIGLILVDGLIADRDWLRIDDVIGAVGHAGDHQVIWFKGRSMPLPRDEGFATAVEASRILVAEERLSTALARLRQVGRLADLLTPDSEEAGRVTFKDGRSLEVSPEDRLRVGAVASIVDDAWTAPPTPLTQDPEFAAFRRFHGEPGSGRSLVEGVRRGFAIERDYEEDLGAQVFAAIKSHASVQTPIILHGQSATGKSIALARIVAKVREDGAAAVLYAKNRIPQSAEIAEFCHKAEGAGAKATLIVCDTNQDFRPYADLLSGLRSGGHRVVVLGSRYRFIDDRGERLETSVEAPAVLSQRERSDLSSLLRRLSDQQVPPVYLTDHNILSFLYRVLPPTRLRISSSLSAEASQTEQIVRDQRADYMASRPPRTLMAQRLIEAGAADAYDHLFDDRQRRAIESVDAAAQVIDLVMAAGSLSCPVPFNLLLRLTTDGNSMSLTEVSDIFGGLDLFRWIMDGENNELLVGPRLALEAELICRRRLGGAEREAEQIITLIGAIRGVGVERDHEKRFLFKILRQVGPNGPRGSRFRAAYVRIAKTLTDLRTRYGVIDASLVLQESAFRRHAVREGAVKPEVIMALLTEARDAVQSTIDDIATGGLNAPRRTQRFLKVELASLYGFIAYRQAAASRSNEEVWSTYLAARSSVRQAASATDSYFPMDVGLWTPADILDMGKMKDWQRAEMTADIYDILDQIDLDALGPEQREKFDKRRLKTANAIGDQELSDAAFADLVESGSPAGCYLRARQIAPNWRDHAETFSDEERQKAKFAADFLHDHMLLIKGDPRSLSLLLECSWIWEVGRRPFVNQRQPLPATERARRLLLDIVTMLNLACGENPRNMSRYLAAALTWTVGSEAIAMEMFRELARDAEYEDPRRVVQHHLITAEEGHVQRFDGRVENEPHSGTCKVRLDGPLRQIVRLRTRDFPRDEITYGRQVRGFGVAFNFIGPIATPIIAR